ncbi:PKD domain-containing protein, partial [uncultured Maribacter sp.]|uniref:PKD domain-containing protein n=1 Tax=uncultured Maribacter sp. TaxID=431308 RepID=UPI00262D9CA6
MDFNGSSSSDDNGIVSYEWDFGDGDTGSGVQLSHVYTSSGTYNAVLTVTDSSGQTATDTLEITVEPSLGSPV